MWLHLDMKGLRVPVWALSFTGPDVEESLLPPGRRL